MSHTRRSSRRDRAQDRRNFIRRLGFEVFEDRRMLAAAPYMNAANPYDVNADGVADGTDLWHLNQELEARGERPLGNPNGPVNLFWDVDGNGKLEWLDAELNLRAQTNTLQNEAPKKGSKTTDSGGGGITTLSGGYTVTLMAPGNVYEGAAWTLRGIVSPVPPPSTMFTPRFNWGQSPGDGVPPMQVMIDATGEFRIPHIYFDDGASPGNGTSSDVETITLSGSILGSPVSAQAMTLVNNVNPVAQLTLTNTNTPFGGPRWQIGGTIQDASMTDKHTITIDWGDGAAPTVIPNVSTNVHFDTPQHEYPTNNESGVPKNFPISVTVVDDDTGTAQAAGSVPVYLFDLDNDANNDWAINAADDPIENTYPGRLMFVNSDDDNQNCVDDSQENPVAGEDDLVPFLVRWQAVARPELQNYDGWRIALSMDPGQTGSAKVWETMDKTGQIIFDQVTDYGFARIWTVGTDPIPGELFLEATATGGIKLILAFYTPAPSWTLASVDEVVFTARSPSPGAVNLTIYDGNEGFPAIDEDVTGAVTVANINNTDADAMVDNVDTDGVLGTQSIHGRNEVDLMKLVVHRPTNYAGGAVVLTATPASRVRLWNDPQKVSPAWEYDPATGVANIGEWNPNCDHRIFWVEITSPSQSVADITLTAQYGGASDSVKATGVWATRTAVEFADKNWIPDLVGTTWDIDMDESLQNYVTLRGGTGRRPPLVIDQNVWVQNIMLMRFTVTPQDVQQLLPRVKFDISRRVEAASWGQSGSAPIEEWYPDNDGDGVPDPWPEFPTKWEEPNDDSGNSDESAFVRPGGNVFVLDGPGIAPGSPYWRSWQYANFEDFVRVDFKGSRPTGNTISGTITSGYYPWHSRVSVEFDWALNIWVRMTSLGDNLLGPEWIELPIAP